QQRSPAPDLVDKSARAAAMQGRRHPAMTPTAGGPLALLHRIALRRDLTDLTDAALLAGFVARGDITWRAVWDGARGPIMTRRNIQGLPTLYVIDQRGVIRSRDGAEELAELVGELLKDGK